MSPRRRNADDLRAASRLAVEAVHEVSRVVQEMHVAIGGGPPLLGRPLAGPLRLITAPVYGGIRATASLVGAALDAALGQLDPLLGSSVPGADREAVVAALNGILGDYLHDHRSALALEMELRREGLSLPLNRAALAKAVPHATPKVLVLVHGSSMNDLQWRRHEHDHGLMLEHERGFTAVYARYNSGLHISTNGAELAHLLDRVVTAWPTPIERLSLLGHSMGGLVARSAIRAAEDAGLHWRSHLSDLITLGTPHHGAPLEQGGSWLHLLLGASAYSAPLGRLAEVRSAGVTDLRFGSIRDEDWQGRDRFSPLAEKCVTVPLPRGVACSAVAATTAQRRVAGRLPGDGLVPIASALGQHREAKRRLGFPRDRQLTVLGTDHLGLLDHPEVAEALREWLT